LELNIILAVVFSAGISLLLGYFIGRAKFIQKITSTELTVKTLKEQLVVANNNLKELKDNRIKLEEHRNELRTNIQLLKQKLRSTLEQAQKLEIEKKELTHNEKSVKQQLTKTYGAFSSAKASNQALAKAHKENKQNIELLKKEIKAERNKIEVISEEKNLVKNKLAESASSLTEKEISLEKTYKENGKNTELLKIEINIERDRVEKISTEKNLVENKLAEITSSLAEKEVSFKRQLNQIDEQKEQLKSEFENIANRVLDDKGKIFSERTQESIGTLLKPFGEQINMFRLRSEDIHEKEVQQRAEMKTELSQLQKMHIQMTEEANNLSKALQGQKKMQGNWGELILENVLDRSGLQNGKDYKREVSFNTEEGRRRPDVVIYLPDNKHLVIDSKVSLEQYKNFVNEEDATKRNQAIKQHVANVSARINELSDKSYYQLPGLRSPEMVFMFIPIESAFVEALKYDESIFQSAIEKNVLVATPTTLLTSLNIVRQLWRFEDQNKHTAELATKAGRVYDKLNAFLGSMELIGKYLSKAQETYDKGYSQLYNGRGNLIKQANEFKKLGVSVKAELPSALVEKAELELMDKNIEIQNQKND